MAELITQPSVIINQGDLLLDEGSEYPLNVIYYDGFFTIEQDGRYVVIPNAHAKKVFKEIMKHLPEAEKFYNNKTIHDVNI